MTKNLMFGSMVTAVLLLGTGCGSDSSSSSDAELNVERIAYYIDAAVSGASYSCVSNSGSTTGTVEASTEEETQNSDERSGEEGETSTTTSDEGTDATQSSESNETTSNKLTGVMQKTYTGTTSADGAFSYEEGQVCTFSVGGIVLRTIDTSTMEDNIVFEDDINTARFLQTLDNDGNPDNGIQIDERVSTAIASGEIDLGGTLPQTDEEMTNLVTQLQEHVDTYEGELVSQEEAQAHLEDTAAYIEAINGHFSGSEEEQEGTNPMDNTPAVDQEESNPMDNTPAVDQEGTNPMDNTPAVDQEESNPMDNTPAVDQEETDPLSNVPTITNPTEESSQEDASTQTEAEGSASTSSTTSTPSVSSPTTPTAPTTGF